MTNAATGLPPSLSSPAAENGCPLRHLCQVAYGSSKSSRYGAYQYISVPDVRKFMSYYPVSSSELRMRIMPVVTATAACFGFLPVAKAFGWSASIM